jgi:hypothetical protein
MRRYFRGPNESVRYGEGILYVEFRGGRAARQVDIFGDHWFTSLDDYHDGVGPGLTDQPLSKLSVLPEWEISQEEFEQVWEEAMRRRQNRQD